LARDFGKVQSVCVGANFMFGHRRSGNVALLNELGGQLGFAVHAVPDVDLDGQPVSSTRIRDAVRAGDFSLAGQMLGRPYTLCGSVIQGRQLGRKFGFPTANIDAAGILTPLVGVYAAEASVGAERRRAAVNIGRRPTIHGGDSQIHVEAHLLDFERDIVGQNLELTFLKMLREEKKFPSTDALRAPFARKSPRMWRKPAIFEICATFRKVKASCSIVRPAFVSSGLKSCPSVLWVFLNKLPIGLSLWHK